MQTHTWHTWHTWHTHLLVVFSTYCMCKIIPTVFSFHQPSWLSNFSVFCLIHWEMLSMRIQFYILQPSLSVWVYCLCKNLERDRLQNWKSLPTEIYGNDKANTRNHVTLTRHNIQYWPDEAPSSHISDSDSL